MVSRRNFLISAGLSLALASGFGSVSIGNSKIDELVRKVNDEIGDYDRKLVAIGDIEHLDYDEDTAKFIEGLGNEIELSKVFMEGVYYDKRKDNPHVELMRDSTIINGMPWNYEEFRKEDPYSYFRLMENFDIVGVEDRDLFFKGAIYGLMDVDYRKYRKLGLFSSMKRLRNNNKLLEMRFGDRDELIDMLAGNIRTGPDFDRDETYRGYCDRVWEHVLVNRNNYASEVIDDNLRSGEYGALVIGNCHVDRDEQENHHLYNGQVHLLPELLEKKGIGVYVLNTDDIKELI